ncbi:hypothetical protein [Leucobacter sp. M11]|uniref:hypothetical protein n=1 Tax=Leucobacter sp. M11 TaxID=2993565 RepID=UPI002D7E23C4|nr:hypothetical protein [Leucobacter sp. M11]MEB4616163.1 hypothetical protein [Leucobacter sp. M11]
MTPIRPTTLTRAAAAALALTLGAVLAGCAAGPSDSPKPAASEATESPAPSESEPTESESAPAGVDMDKALAERDAFIRDQQLPLDGSTLVAVTEGQKAFIAEEKAFIESQGATWGGAEQEGIYLALAADACETAILNGHRIDTTTLETHVGTSPLFASLIPAEITGAERQAAERNVASIMVNGTKYLCEPDFAQWSAAFDAGYPAP